MYKTVKEIGQRIYYKTTEYTTAGTYTFISNGQGSFEIAINGAGGGGTKSSTSSLFGTYSHSDRGGAGGRIYGIINIPVGAYEIVIGTGGTGRTSSRDDTTSATGTAGTATTFLGNTANGGGGSYSWSDPGSSRGNNGTAGTTNIVTTGLSGTDGGGSAGGYAGTNGTDGYIKIVQSSSEPIPDYDYYTEFSSYKMPKEEDKYYSSYIGV